MSAQLNGIGRWSDSKAKRQQQPSAQPCCDSEEASLDEFLEHELLCWLNEDKPIGQEVATLRPELYGELNHLFGVAANEADNRCVEDILAEAERLMLQDTAGTETDPTAQSPMGWSELLLPEMDPSPKHDAPYLRTLSPECVKVSDVGCRATYNATPDGRPRSQTMDSMSKPPNENLSASSPIINRTPTPPPPSTPRQRRHLHDQPTPIKPVVETRPDIAASPTDQCGPNRGLRQPNANGSTSCPVQRRQMCDRSTQPSPVPEDDEPDQYASWSKERLLEGKITELQERLKDTEERYHSLKLQYDTLSQVHRTLRENYGAMQEESEKLQFDIQHLTKCADVLRSELQSARCDRDSAIELQKILQSELDESRKEKKKLQDSSEKDSKTIQDLQRQCREMERILMRKNPDSISALIVASKSPTGKPESDGSTSTTCRLLEQRIAQLEADAKKQDAKAQGILADVQARFNSVQAKYETHIADLEMQVLSLQEINSKLNEKIIRQMEELASISSHAAAVKTTGTACFTQTDAPVEESGPECRARKRDVPASVKVRSILVQTDVTGTGVETAIPTSRQPSAKRAQAQSKEDAHLLATIRGMRVDLAIKEKAVQRLTREVDECKKTIKKLQKKKDPVPVGAGRGDSGRSPAKVRNKVADSCADSGPDAGAALRDAQSKVKILELDYKALQDKRLQDLKTLQAAHEKELASCHESIRFLQQRLAESEEELLQRKDKQRPNHSNDYYGLKAKRKRTLKRVVTPRQGQTVARKWWLSAGRNPSTCQALVQHLLNHEFHSTKTSLQQRNGDNKTKLLN
ncbi:E3 ubiquitin-protein ligase BRE1B isoform X1 [Anopheles stephensi]|uniref:E3 ubiquitin-protein ligase BRE1B isoform X1 n=1 Tax=Anopheles stephensi TaxID=30069 RepID=UPI0016587DF3|nr:E3 ubiquitin-protein ligase BRE1B isoform X1 [Anopheles stephensi]